MMRAAAWLAFACAGVPGAAQDPLELAALQRVTQQAIDRVAPCVVRVETFGGARRVLAGDDAGDGQARPRREQPDRPPQKPPEEKPGPLVMPGFLQARGATTGVVLSADGWILISRFAINFDPSTILVTLPDGRSFDAKRGGEDTSRGIALVKIAAEGLPVPEFVAPERVRVGQWAIALGRTFGASAPSVHFGIVSATRRLFGRALQIDANTSPANYGGPVIDVEGRVLGIAAPLSPSGRDAGVDWYDSGIGFATTVADIGPILDQLRGGEVLHRGFLGIAYDAKDPGPGVLLDEVTADSPAKAAGMKKGDRIEALDGFAVRNSFHMLTLVAAKMAGDPLHIEFRRSDGSATAITVFLAAVPERERGVQSQKEEAFTPPWYDDEPPPPESR